MIEPLRNEAREWLCKALYDLGSARRLAEEPETSLDTAIHHCQQAVEKAVKGFLTLHEIRYEQSQDIEVLTSLAAQVLPGFRDWLTAGKKLAPYATTSRRSADTPEPDQAEFEQALQMACGYVSFVFSVVPDDVRPPQF